MRTSLFLILGTVIAGACGVKGPPLPPEKETAEVSVIQQTPRQLLPPSPTPSATPTPTATSGKGK